MALAWFWEWCEGRKHATEMVAAPANRNAKPKVAVPLYPTLSDVLALDADDENGPVTEDDVKDLLAQFGGDQRKLLAFLAGVDDE